MPKSDAQQTAAPSLTRVAFALPMALVAGVEAALYARLPQAVGPIGRAATALLTPYFEIRARALLVISANWPWLLPLALLITVVALLLLRQGLLFWHKEDLAQLRHAYHVQEETLPQRFAIASAAGQRVMRCRKAWLQSAGWGRRLPLGRNMRGAGT